MTVDIEKLEALAEHHQTLGHAYTLASPATVLELIKDLKRNQRMLLAAVCQMGEINTALGADMDSDCDELIGMIADLKSEISGLKTGYEAYERVNAELRAECEALKKRLAPVDNFNRQQVPVIGYTGCFICGQFTDHGGLPCPKTSATAWASTSMEQSHD